MLHVPKAVDKKGMLVVPGVPLMEICVFPSREASRGIINYPTDLIRRGPAGGRVTVPLMTRSWPMVIVFPLR